MKRLNFNIKDRKVLTLGLCLILVCVFTLTIAYAALNAVLTIQGSAQVSSADWDIHLANPKVTSGSVTTNVPEIKSSGTLEFETTLNMPGDFYEFTVDVVNSGSIDAMIESVIKNPELDASQKKYLNYEVTYQNGQSINTKQLVEKESFVRLKVRVEFRKDITASDMPTTSETLNLAFTVNYVQSDGSSDNFTIENNGKIIYVDGDINKIGTIVKIGSEQFYTIGTESDNVKLLSMYNLYVGGEYDSNLSTWTPYGEEATGKQDENMNGYVVDQNIRKGTTLFSSAEQKGTNYSDYSGSIVEKYVNNYKELLESDFGVGVVEARLIRKTELMSSTFMCSTNEYTCTNSAYPWIYATSYFTMSVNNPSFVWIVQSDGEFFIDMYRDYYFGVRPVIVISKDYFN